MGDYVELASVRMWFDERGAGEGSPVALLHGGLCTADTWMMQVDALADHRRVLLPEQRGHGHNPDVGDLSYDLMAADTIAFLEAVAGAPADLVGWSDGGNIALHVALERPDLVRKVVTIGSNFHHEGTLPQFLEGAEQADDGGENLLRDLYEAVSPDGPEHWPVLQAKVLAMWRSGPILTVEDLRRIHAPTLVMVGDDDAIHLSHTVELYEALPHGQLAVLPGSSHLVPIERPALVNQLIVDFLDDGSVVSLLPMRRVPG
jgi:pimeloyl-ACP methyl ester carboxylesterase